MSFIAVSPTIFTFRQKIQERLHKTFTLAFYELMMVCQHKELPIRLAPRGELKFPPSVLICIQVVFKQQGANILPPRRASPGQFDRVSKSKCHSATYPDTFNQHQTLNYMWRMKNIEEMNDEMRNEMKRKSWPHLVDHFHLYSVVSIYVSLLIYLSTIPKCKK